VNQNTHTPTRTPKDFIEDRNRNLSSTSTLAIGHRRGNPRTTCGPPASGMEPAFISIAAVADYMAESQWTVKNKLRLGIYVAKKSGRRTLVVFESVKQHAASLPDASFAAPRRKRATS